MSKQKVQRPTGRRHPDRAEPEPLDGRVELTVQEAEMLVGLAGFYERSMGPMRHVVRLTAPDEVRSKFRFVAEESRWLRGFAEATYKDMLAAGQTSAPTSLTPRTLIAFWGRLLASLNNRRSRRRLSAEQLQEREALADKFRTAARQLFERDPDLIEREMATRRTAEAAWMREQLGITT